jgi:DNA-directed RNA polymerase specialized sigma24 family protein
MNAPEWPLSELVELHQSFLSLRQIPGAAKRLDLAYRIVLDPASMARIDAAVSALLRQVAGRVEPRAELVQQVMLQMVVWLSAETLRYDDVGIERFGKWYWRLCRRASLRAWKTCRLLGFRSINALEPVDVPFTPELSVNELQWEDVLSAIPKIRNRLVKAVMIAFAAGHAETQIAQDHGISQAHVSHLRQRGLTVLRGLCVKELSRRQ